MRNVHVAGSSVFLTIWIWSPYMILRCPLRTSTGSCRICLHRKGDRSPIM